MTKPPLHPSIRPLHLYRSILRECSYLPDRTARTQCASQARANFERRRHAQGSILESAFARARRAASILARANNGELAALRRVLFLAYGRVGPRKHKLFAELHAEATRVGEEGFQQPDRPDSPKPVKEPTRQPPLLPPGPIRALFIAQQRLEPSGHSIKLSSPSDTNAWGRPMPLSRVRMQRRKALTKIYSRLLAPVPKAEWEQLRDLATGAVPATYLRSGRRKRTADDGPELVSPLSWLKFKVGAKNRGVQSRQIRSRQMRRLWTEVLEICPLVSFDEEKKQWRVSYFKRTEMVRLNAPIDQHAQHPIFQGVNQKGRLLATG
jgi:hypothetical protein